MNKNQLSASDCISFPLSLSFDVSSWLVTVPWSGKEWDELGVDPDICDRDFVRILFLISSSKNTSSSSPARSLHFSPSMILLVHNESSGCFNPVWWPISSLISTALSLNSEALSLIFEGTLILMLDDNFLFFDVFFEMYGCKEDNDLSILGFRLLSPDHSPNSNFVADGGGGNGLDVSSSTSSELVACCLVGDDEGEPVVSTVASAFAWLSPFVEEDSVGFLDQIPHRLETMATKAPIQTTNNANDNVEWLEVISTIGMFLPMAEISPTKSCTFLRSLSPPPFEFSPLSNFLENVCV